jgi:osmotically-inducible protein OsmY
MTKWKYIPITGAAFILTGTSAAWAANPNSSIGGGLDDGTITARVKTAIAQHRDLGPPNQISVDTRDHVVYLSGMVFNGLSGKDAEEIAQEVPGVTRVVTTIGVDE